LTQRGLVTPQEKEGIKMPRKTFFSFHYIPDSWRAAQVRNAGVVEGNVPVSDNEWEEVTKGGDPALPGGHPKRSQ